MIPLALALCLLQDPVSLKAGFAEEDITPEPGTRKCGWNSLVYGRRVLDPLFARAAVFESGGGRAGFIALDVLFVHRDTTAEIRRRVQERTGFPAEALLVAATHNHAGPAVEADLYPREDAYVERMIDRAAEAFVRAWQGRREAELGRAGVFEWNVAYNRRVLYRNGTVRCHGSFRDPDALAFEGPVDPEVAVLAARSKEGAPLGALVNFACHPCHHGGDDAFSAGYPGQLALALKEKGWPVALFLQGAAGNLHHNDPSGVNKEKTMAECGRVLAAAAEKAIGLMKFRPAARLSARSRTIELPYRAYTEADLRGTARGAQRFGEPGFYDKTMPALLEEIRRKNGKEPAEVQGLFLDEFAYVAVPAEYFVEHGLRIKEETYPARTRVVGYANGMVGYVPHREAFRRGGYEVTFGIRSKLAPEAGDLLAETAIELVKSRK